ncbi:MAG: glycoside hydrolase family 55 protein [Clostridia bacterium]|nr:glycoside hydrolase family 55 protein [Clostridia bacterium]
MACSNEDAIDYTKTDFSFLETFDYGKVHKSDAVSIFDTVEELSQSTDEKLSEGCFIKTNGYYVANDKGGASYVIEKEANSGAVTLKNGLFANIVADKCSLEKQEFYVINAKQFGAKVDGVSADQAAINSAIEYLNGLDGQRILYLPKGEYRVDNEILANDMKNTVITGAGDDTVIFTDNGYTSWWEFFFACWRDENCFFGNFKIEARESWGQNRYFRQLTLIDCNNCYLYNLTLNVPETAWDGKPFDRVDSTGNVTEPNSFDKQYTNLTLYSGNKNITVDGCTMYQMSGTYRGANIGIMDFYERGTENITIKNCELHDNARDEQVGIFSRSNAANSSVTGVNFLNNKVFTHQTPYKDLIGGRTMCFTVAYDNAISNINIEGNEFVSYADSKFMTFGSVKDCTVKSNKITVISSCGKAGYVFDSSCADDNDVIIDGNEFYLTYATTPVEGKCVSAGRLTFKNNKVISDCTVDKIADRLGIYEHNDFRMLGSFGSCGSAIKFNHNNVTCYGEHSNQYNEMFFNHSGDGTFNENTVLEFIGNTVTDYTYYNGAKNQKIFDRLCTINNVNIKELRITDNVYNCPNYRYSSPDDYMWICWVRNEAKITNFICENNDLQGAKTVYGAEGGSNTLREFNTDAREPSATEIEISYYKETSTLAVSGEGNVEWFALGKNATVENEVVTGNGEITVFAAKTDGSGVYAKVTFILEHNTTNNTALVAIIVSAIFIVVVAIVSIMIILLKRRNKK